MKQTATVGTNRTGVAVAPERLQEMLSGMEEFPPSAQGNAQEIAQVRIAYAQLAEPPGSVPLPPTLKGKIATTVQAIKEEQFSSWTSSGSGWRSSGRARASMKPWSRSMTPMAASRAARAGTISSTCCRNTGATMLQAAIEQLGGDPTAVTPSANLQATAAHGIQKVVVDPRTTLLQSWRPPSSRS